MQYLWTYRPTNHVNQGGGVAVLEEGNIQIMTFTLHSYQDYYHMFQPLFCLSERQPLGYEALLRSHSIARPDQLFHLAAQNNQLFDLDIMSIYNSISVFFQSSQHRDTSELLFLNLFPSTIAEQAFADICEAIRSKYHDVVGRIVFEINESMSEMGEWDRERFILNVNLLRKSGFRIAFDDVGEGATTLKRIVELAPDFIKIDQFFGMQLATNKKKQHIVKFFVDYCTDGTKLILEGLEDPEDVKLAIRLGVSMGQGYWLAQPGPLPGVPLTYFHSLSPI